MTAFQLAYLSLVRRKASSLIAIVAIAISVACSGWLLKLFLLSSSRFESLAPGGQAIVGAKSGGLDILLGSLNGEAEDPGFIPDKLFLSLRQQTPVKFEDGAVSRPSFVRSVIPMLFFGQFHGHRVVGTDESFFRRPEPRDQLSFASGAWAKSETEIVLGSRVAKEFGLQTGGSMVAELSSGPREFRIAGVLNASGTSTDRLLFAPIETAQKAVAHTVTGEKSIWGPQVLNYFLVYLEPGGFSQLSALINKRTVAQAILVETERTRLDNLTGAGRTIGLSVVALVLLLGLLSVAGLMITRFEGMNIQIAVLRAIGYSSGEVGQWLLAEGLLLGSLACVLGVTIDAAAFPFLRAALGEALPAESVQSLSLFASWPVWLISIAATVVSVLIPLWKIRRQDVHSALRGL